MIETIDIRLPRLMDRNLHELCRIRPEKLSYTLNMAPLSIATLTMPKSEAEVSVGQFMELYDTQGSIGIFRVENIATTYKPGFFARMLEKLGIREASVTVTLKHALCTLEDGVVIGYQEFGGTGKNLRSVLAALLAMQPRIMWQLGTVDYNTAFQYSFENEGLLTAIISLAEPLSDEYLWSCDFSTSPWTLNLITAPEGDQSEMRLGRNIDNVKVEVDRSELCTRLWPLGYGEGVNQLTISNVNNNKKYLDSDTVSAWGVVNSVYAETSVTDAATLKAMAEQVLERVKQPKVTVTVSGIDLSALTGEPFDRFYVGRKCRVPLPDYGLWIDERVISIQKNDVFGDNAKVKVTLANRGADAVNDLANISRKTAIGELYSQGATNQYAVHYADNADASNALDCEFYIDQNAVWINSVMCKFKTEGFRAYSKGAKSGGGSTSGDGGGASSEVKTLSSSNQSTQPVGTGTTIVKTKTDSTTVSAIGDSHNHAFDHYHFVSVIVQLPAGLIKVPSHTHSLPDHSHDIEYGIYRGPTASSVTVKVDGTAVPASAITNGEFDAVPYISKDSAGKITRGTWHKITFTPNGQARIVADLHVKTFIRSISGGNY